MNVVRTASQMTSIAEDIRKQGQKISFVPTMGALHEGHLSLFREGKKQSDFLVASIYVNPRQFNDPQDFLRYTRDLENDLKKCESEGVDVVFVPTDAEIYPVEEKTSEIPVPLVANRLEGISRPGHFDGVVAVVARLFRIVQPHIAIFGLKDYQQVRVIEEMVKEQKIDVSILRHPTIREKDGLAMSSRNSRLTPEGRQTALLLSKALKAGDYLFQKGERNPRKIETALKKGLEGKKIKIDYLQIVDAESLSDIAVLEKPALLAIAVYIDGVRLIDNCLLSPAQIKK